MTITKQQAASLVRRLIARAVSDRTALAHDGGARYDPSKDPLMTEAHAYLATLTEPDRSTREAMDFIQMAVEFAFEQGLHEVGYDPVAVVRKAVGLTDS